MLTMDLDPRPNEFAPYARRQSDRMHWRRPSDLPLNRPKDQGGRI